MGIIVSLTLTCFFLFLKRNGMTKIYVLWSILLVFYLSVLLSEVVGFPNLLELNQILSSGYSFFNSNVNVIPFSGGFDISSFLNIIAFIPLGIALDVMWVKFQKIIPTVLVGLFFSMTIEIGQLFTMYRQTDVNDIIMNTLGVSIGWVLNKYFFKWIVQRKEGKNMDWLLFVFISLISVFILG